MGLLLAATNEEEQELTVPSQDFRNVLDGPGERYWLDKKEREKERRRKREAERIEALEAELRELEREEEARRKPAIVPNVEVEPEAAPKKKRGAMKRAVIETPELNRAQLLAIEAAEARARQYDEEAAIILLLAA